MEKTILIAFIAVSAIEFVCASPIFSGTSSYFRHRGPDFGSRDQDEMTSAKRYAEQEDDPVLQSLMNEILELQQAKNHYQLVDDLNPMDLKQSVNDINRYLKKTEDAYYSGKFPRMDFGRPKQPTSSEDDSQEHQDMHQGHKHGGSSEGDSSKDDDATSAPDATTSKHELPLTKKTSFTDTKLNMVPPVSPANGQKEYAMLRPLNKKNTVVVGELPQEIVDTQPKKSIDYYVPKFQYDPLMEELDHLSKQ